MHKAIPIPNPKPSARKASRLVWIKRRARRLMRFFRADRATAVAEATVDWYRFNGKPLPKHMDRLCEEGQA